MSDLDVIVAGREDLPALVESVTGLFHDDAGQHDPGMDLEWPAREGMAAYGQDLGNPAVRLLLAREAERVVGHLVGKIREPSSIRPHRLAVLESMRVAPEAQGRGVGSRLVQEFFAWAREHGCTQAQVTAYAANHGAQRFYARHGFTPYETTLAADLGR